MHVRQHIKAHTKKLNHFILKPFKTIGTLGPAPLPPHSTSHPSPSPAYSFSSLWLQIMQRVPEPVTE